MKIKLFTSILFVMLITFSSFAQTSQVDSALTIAKRGKKNVLVEFRADWCKWCKRLEATFQSAEIKTLLETSYVLVKIDIGRYDKNLDVASKYGLDLKKSGIPALIVLNSRGKVRKIQNTGELEEGEGHSVEKIINFLNKYKK